MMKFFTHKISESQHFITSTREIQYLWTLQCYAYLLGSVCEQRRESSTVHITVRPLEPKNNNKNNKRMF
jgi:hypothetical protein